MTTVAVSSLARSTSSTRNCTRGSTPAVVAWAVATAHARGIAIEADATRSKLLGGHDHHPTVTAAQIVDRVRGVHLSEVQQASRHHRWRGDVWAQRGRCRPRADGPCEATQVVDTIPETTMELRKEALAQGELVLELCHTPGGWRLTTLELCHAVHCQPFNG